MESTQNKIYEIEETTPQQFKTEAALGNAVDQVNDPDQYGDKFEDAKQMELGDGQLTTGTSGGATGSGVPGTGAQSKMGGPMIMPGSLSEHSHISVKT